MRLLIEIRLQLCMLYLCVDCIPGIVRCIINGNVLVPSAFTPLFGYKYAFMPLITLNWLRVCEAVVHLRGR